MKGAVQMDRSFRHDGLRVATPGVTPSCRSAEGKRVKTTHSVARSIHRAARSAGIVVPVDGRPQAFRKGCGRLPAERGSRSRDVDFSAGLAVGLRRIEADLAFETGRVGDQPDQVFDADLFAAAKIDRLRTVVALERGNDPFGAV